jgi:hypothetical protein
MGLEKPRLLPATVAVVVDHAQPGRCVGRDSSRGASRKAELLLSVSLAMEYEAVCLRPEHQIAAELSEQEVHIFVDALIWQHTRDGINLATPL